MKNPIMSQINWLRSKGWTESALSKKIGVSQMTVSRWSREEPVVANLTAVGKLGSLYSKQMAEEKHGR